MTNVIQLPEPDQNTYHARVAAEVRGYLAKKRIPVYKINQYLDVQESRGYWQRRVSGEIPMNVNDLDNIAKLVGINVSQLLPEVDSNHQPAGLQLAWITSLSNRNSQGLLPKTNPNRNKDRLAQVTQISSAR